MSYRGQKFQGLGVVGGEDGEGFGAGHLLNRSKAVLYLGTVAGVGVMDEEEPALGA